VKFSERTESLGLKVEPVFSSATADFIAAEGGQ
jgi:hypothetical protein